MQFSAILLLEKHLAVTASQIQSELKRFAPQATLGDWGGSMDLATNPGAEMISINGEPMSVLDIPAPAKETFVERGHFANHIWPNVEADVARHTAQLFITAARKSTDHQSAIAQARAVTLLAAAVARIVPFIGIKWVDGSNSMEAKSFIRATENIGQPDANAVPFWIRVMLHREPSKGDQIQMIGGTLGLHYFGLLDLEYAASPLEPQFIMQHAYSTAEYLLRSGKTLQDGETIGVEGQPNGFKISHVKDGLFVPYPVARLDPLSEKRKWWKW
jgi:hypothetical protein